MARYDDLKREYEEARAADAARKAARATMAGENTGFNGSVLALERVLEAVLHSFNGGFPADPAAHDAARQAVTAAQATLTPLQRLRHALTTPAARALVDRLHAEDQAAQASP